MNELIEQISTSLRDDNTEQNRQKWASYIITSKIDLYELRELLFLDYPVAIRFSWILGNVCAIRPELVYPIASFIFTNRKQISIPNFDRTIAKVFSLAGIPNDIEGEAIDQLFSWLMDATILVSTKAYSVSALYLVCKIYPDLTKELKLVIEDQLSKNTIAFEKRATMVLKALAKDENKNN
jgi:hypothetical protein